MEAKVLGKVLCEHTEEIFKLWRDKRQKNANGALKNLPKDSLINKLPVQLKAIGKELQKQKKIEVEDNQHMWELVELHSSERVSQNMSIEELMEDYRMLLSAVWEFTQFKGLEISKKEYAYFSQTVMNIASQSVSLFFKAKSAEVAHERAEYLAGLAHQMRNPLMVLVNQVELLEAHAGSIDEEGIERLKRNIRRLKFLINGTMRLERFNSEEMPVHPKKFYPGKLVKKIARDNDYRIKDKDIEVKVDVDQALEMKTDVNLFTDIVGNLIDNAFKYTDKGKVEVEMKEENKELLFKVADTGQGISLERQEQIFKPTLPEASGGAGLGLAITRHAAKALGGKIEFESEPGKGSTFCVRLPKKIPPKLWLRKSSTRLK